MACNHDAYPPDFEAAWLKIAHTYYTLKSFSAEKGWFLWPRFSLVFGNQTQLILHRIHFYLKYLNIPALSGIRKQSKGWGFFVSVIKAHSYPFSTKAVRGPVRSGCLTSNQFFLWFHSKRTGSWPQWHQLFAGPVPTSAYIRGWGRDYRLLFGVNKNQRIVIHSNCDEQHKCVGPVVFGWHSVTLVRRWYGPPLLLKS